MAKHPMKRMRLDFADAAVEDLLLNLSGVTASDGLLWTVADERRTFECLTEQGDGYALFRQYRIDDLIADWPGADEGGHGAELDLETLDIAQGALWLCGSHCNVRWAEDSDDKDLIRPEIHVRASRHLLARIVIKDDGAELGKVNVAPREGPKSIRGALADDPYLGPFLNLPSKENGLDIEGMAVTENEVLLGLRGPRLDNSAVVVHLRLSEALEVESYRLSFLDLGSLAIRDLSRHGKAIFILAGPVGDALGPFRLYRWEPQDTALIQHPEKLYTWPEGSEKPEGLCLLKRKGKLGHLIVYDRPDDDRIEGSIKGGIKGTTYEADWMAID